MPNFQNPDNVIPFDVIDNSIGRDGNFTDIFAVEFAKNLTR
jgi:hypothetical protein